MLIHAKERGGGMVHGLAVRPRPEEMRVVYKLPVEFRPVQIREGCFPASRLVDDGHPPPYPLW